MPRNKTLFLYNDSKKDQDWHVYSKDVINKDYTVKKDRVSFSLTLSGDVTIRFGVDQTVYLDATYTYGTDSWTSKTVTPKEISFSVSLDAISVTSSYTPD